MTTNKNKNKYNGWLVSDSLIKRSLAVVGYNLLGQLVIFTTGLIAILIILVGIISFLTLLAS